MGLFERAAKPMTIADIKKTSDDKVLSIAAGDIKLLIKMLEEEQAKNKEVNTKTQVVISEFNSKEELTASSYITPLKLVRSSIIGDVTVDATELKNLFLDVWKLEQQRDTLIGELKEYKRDFSLYKANKQMEETIIKMEQPELVTFKLNKGINYDTKC